ncbi:MAG: hypothetical protein ACLQDY_30510 [Streptosporangiaceae bacterium]
MTSACGQRDVPGPRTLRPGPLRPCWGRLRGVITACGHFGAGQQADLPDGRRVSRTGVAVLAPGRLQASRPEHIV